jgi:2-polyprenyl-3-methyl-5-hydroxy-6-metoxy-1,4-benzoquinol methylase
LKDERGSKILEVIAKADKFNKWMFETIRPYCHGNTLEIGSGIGNISLFFIQHGYSITLSDTNEYYIEQLKKNFKDTRIFSIDLVNEDFPEKYARLLQTFDTVVFLNVLEHIDNEKQAIENCRKLLKPGGSLVVLVPAYTFLFSKMDRELQHYRRYTSKRLFSLVSKKKFIVKKVFYFNALGIVAWTYGKFLGLHSIPSKEMKLFNNLVPLAKFIDKILFKKTGLSVIMVAQKDL